MWHFTTLNFDSLFSEGINKGSSVYLFLLKQLGVEQRRVAFYHRNTSEQRKQDILEDLKKPLSSPGKKYLAVVATVSLGKFMLADHAEYVTEVEDDQCCE